MTQPSRAAFAGHVLLISRLVAFDRLEFGGSQMSELQTVEIRLIQREERTRVGPVDAEQISTMPAPSADLAGMLRLRTALNKQRHPPA